MRRDFYLQSWGYLSCIEAGAERVDLNGKKAGIVTEQEQMSAQKRIRDEKATVAKGRISAPALPPIQYGAPMPAANGSPLAMAPAADVSPLADSRSCLRQQLSCSPALKTQPCGRR